MAAPNISVMIHVVLLCEVIAVESFAVVKHWGPSASTGNIEKETNTTKSLHRQETQQNEKAEDVVLILAWVSLCTVFLVFFGIVVKMTTRKYVNRIGEVYQHKLTVVENPLYQLKRKGTPFIKSKKSLPTIPEEDLDEYIAVTGFLTFHKPSVKYCSQPIRSEDL